jgi:putative ABC transport system ATP-binding protein
VLDLLLETKKVIGQTLVMVTHDLSIARRADRILKMDNGILSPMMPSDLNKWGS